MDDKPLFYVCAKLLSGEFLEVDLSPTAGGHPGCLGAMTTVATLKERIADTSIALTGVHPERMRLVFAGKGLEDQQSLAHYHVARGLTLHVLVVQTSTPFFPLAPAPDPHKDQPMEPLERWCTKLAASLPAQQQRKRGEMLGWYLEHAGVHVWRVGRDYEWVELVLQGPPGSFYEGGTFLLRVAFSQEYPFRPFALRLLTPLYHPTVGPAGYVGVLDHDTANGWSPARVHRKVVKDFVKQIQSYELSLEARGKIEAENVQMNEMLAEWTNNGEERARTKAQLWTWHFATPQGRAYLRSGRRCSGLTLLADLVAIDRQVRDDVRVTLLIANRQAMQLEREPDAPHHLLGGLPRELLHAVLFEIASDRSPRAAREWELFNDGDDGLPPDWHARLPDPPEHSPPPDNRSYVSRSRLFSDNINN